MNYDWTITIDGVDVSALVKAGGTIDYGRPTTATSFRAPFAQFEMFTPATFPNYGGAWPTIDLDDEVIIHVTWDGVTQWRRFTGKVQALDWNPYGLQVTAAGTTTDWDLLLTGLTYENGMGLALPDPFPDQTETTRVQALVGQAGATVTIEGVPARRVRAIPRNSTGTPLLDAILRIADDCDALLMEDRLGVAHYRTRNFNRPDPYTIPADLVERDSIDLAYERGTLVNSVTVYYGEPDPTTGLQYSVYDNDAADANTIGTVGPRRTELYTDIQYAAGAEGRARVYLEKNRLEWVMPDVTLLMNQATGAEADDILDLQENWMVEVTDLPTGCPIASYDGDILGMTDIMHETDYRIVLHLGPRIADTGAIPEEPIFAEGSITGGTTSTYEDEFGFLWQLHVWDTAGSYVATCNEAVTPDVLLVGGGGGGGGYSQSSANSGGGGGAGRMYEGELALTPGSITVTVGAGGAGGAGAALNGIGGTGSNGGDTVLAGLTMPGGGGGGGSARNAYGGTGADGGSGGGGGGGGYGGGGAGTAVDGTPLAGYGNDGVAASGGNGGRGGGAGTSGAGRSSSITDTAVTYAVAGSAGSNAAGVTPGSGGGGASGGTSIVAGASGAAGIVALRYRIG